MITFDIFACFSHLAYFTFYVQRKLVLGKENLSFSINNAVEVENKLNPVTCKQKNNGGHKYLKLSHLSNFVELSNKSIE